MSSTPPRWMKYVLYAAAAYNLAWGLFVVLFPRLPFAWAGMDAPNYPAVVQCLGMVIGVYGIGYGIAARDPARHWPIVFVGLLGKLFGPIGFVWAAAHGEFPWLAGLTILANDVAWWLPFTAILLYAAREHDAHRHPERESLEAALRGAVTDRGTSLWDISHQQPVLTVLIRHAGCAFCRETLADLAQQLPQITAAGQRLVVVHMSPPQEGRVLLDQFGLQSIEQISDPERRLYRALELPLGTLTQLAGPQVIWRALTTPVLFRHGIGRMVGHGMQLAGAAVIDHGRVLRSYRHRSSADRPNYAEVACSVNRSPTAA